MNDWCDAARLTNRNRDLNLAMTLSPSSHIAFNIQIVPMYVPAAHRIDDDGLILDLIRRNPFATLVTAENGVPVATHLPILVLEGAPIVLAGHIARANAQWKSMANAEALVIFAGPHGYVSPRWYETTPNVPTWNYVSIHAYGTVEIIEDREFALDHLKQMIDTFDPTLEESQPESTAREYLEKLLPGIVVFRVAVNRIDAKAKLNQNKKPQDRLAVKRVYEDSEIPDEHEMWRLMS